ncbi:MAG: anhydro-N-acetylmuramic acid kinase [Bdellovibrionales bacterium]
MLYQGYGVCLGMLQRIMPAECFTALGLMTGTSMDGIDMALIRTDGEQVVEVLAPKMLVAFDDSQRTALRSVMGGKGDIQDVERTLTDAHAAAVQDFMTEFNLSSKDIDLVGFHGQTIAHNPGRKMTWQIGDGQYLANEIGIPVVNQFRVNDVAAGGQGAPLVPLYHAARAANLAKPVAILNIGGVGNVTYIGADGALLAFDTGPGNALIDDWLLKHTGVPRDTGGKIARHGTVDEAWIAKVLQAPYFAKKPPKSLDRHDFHQFSVDHLDLADGAATLTALTVATTKAALQHFPEPPREWLITGGGRHNAFMMDLLQRVFNVPVRPVESIGWDGDFLEAEAFAYLAVRSKKGLALTLPTTTGVNKPLSGGQLHTPVGKQFAAL